MTRAAAFITLIACCAFCCSAAHADTIFTAELNNCFAPYHTERLVRIAMKMMERVNTSLPGILPVILSEDVFHFSRRE